MVDSAKRNALIQRIEAQPEHEEGRALVNIAEFFDGNDDEGSIGCNLTHHPGLDHFRQVLLNVEDRPDVEQVWLKIYDLEEGDWPFSENVLIVGTAPASEIEELSESLQPSEVSELKIDWTPSRIPTLGGRRYINLWWD